MLDARPAEPPAADCTALEGHARYHCGEHWFWIALSDDLALRADAVERLTEIIDVDSGSDPQALARMYALRGQLRMAQLVEHGRFDVMQAMRADLGKVTEIDPTNPIIPSFADSIDLIMAWNLQDTDRLREMETSIWENVERCPLGNTLSISGIALGLPLSTGWPESIASALGEWECSGADFCTQNTWKAPYARPGLAYHFGETFARVGDADRARPYLEQALVEEGVETWPYRAFVQRSLDDLEGWIADFEALGVNGEAGHLTYAGQTFGCVFCHTHEPPEGLVPDDRLGRHTQMQPFDDGGPTVVVPDDEEPWEPGDGACSDEANTATMAGVDDLGGTVGSCAARCFSDGVPCMTACIHEATDLDEACSTCFAEMGQCTLDHCLTECIQSGPECAPCQAARCQGAFQRCSGMEMP